MIAEDKALSRCTCTAMRMTARHISQAYDRALAPVGLRSGQYALLRTLARIGAVSVQTLAELVMLDRTTIGRNLRPLERDGLVSISVDPADRRGRLLEVTDEGRQRLLDAEKLWATTQERLEATFGGEQIAALHRSFASIMALNLSA